jgi:hypothetical protein
MQTLHDKTQVIYHTVSTDISYIFEITTHRPCGHCPMALLPNHIRQLDEHTIMITKTQVARQGMRRCKQVPGIMALLLTFSKVNSGFNQSKMTYNKTWLVVENVAKLQVLRGRVRQLEPLLVLSSSRRCNAESVVDHDSSYNTCLLTLPENKCPQGSYYMCRCVPP